MQTVSLLKSASTSELELENFVGETKHWKGGGLHSNEAELWDDKEPKKFFF